MKQIRSGQSFLYRTNGYDSTVVEIRMRDKVTGSYLQVALTNAARRFPYLTQKLVEKGAEAIALASCISKGVPLNFPCPNHEQMAQAIKAKIGDIELLNYTH